MLASNEIKIVYKDDSNYPELLRGLPNPPIKLYYKGNLRPELFTNCLSIVGSRNITSYGISIIERFLKEMRGFNVTIVSGFMRGVDMYAHENALQNSLSTIAVLPCGIEYKYNSQLQNTCQKILESGGLLLSEFEGSFSPRDWTFVKRNRIVAGLSSTLLVVEAGENSGSLITYNYAQKYKRKVLTVPGDIYRSSTQGVCRILKEGGLPVFSGKDILEILGFSTKKDFINTKNLNIDPTSTKILAILDQNPCDLSQLCKLSHENFSDVCVLVTKLQMNNFVKEIKGLFYVV